MLCFYASPRWFYSHLRRGNHPVTDIGGDVSTWWPGSISYQGLEARRSITTRLKQSWSKNWCWSRSNLPERYLFRTDQYSRIIFPLAFILVNCVYWCTVLIWFPPASISEIKQKSLFCIPVHYPVCLAEFQTGRSFYICMKQTIFISHFIITYHHFPRNSMFLNPTLGLLPGHRG